MARGKEKSTWWCCYCHQHGWGEGNLQGEEDAAGFGGKTCADTKGERQQAPSSIYCSLQQLWAVSKQLWGRYCNAGALLSAKQN